MCEQSSDTNFFKSEAEGLKCRIQQQNHHFTTYATSYSRDNSRIVLGTEPVAPINAKRHVEPCFAASQSQLAQLMSCSVSQGFKPRVGTLTPSRLWPVETKRHRVHGPCPQYRAWQGFAVQLACRAGNDSWIWASCVRCRRNGPDQYHCDLGASVNGGWSRIPLLVDVILDQPAAAAGVLAKRRRCRAHERPPELLLVSG